jgi:hypothetical protein
VREGGLDSSNYKSKVVQDSYGLLADGKHVRYGSGGHGLAEQPPNRPQYVRIGSEKRLFLVHPSRRVVMPRLTVDRVSGGVTDRQ